MGKLWGDCFKITKVPGRTDTVAISIKLVIAREARKGFWGKLGLESRFHLHHGALESHQSLGSHGMTRCPLLPELWSKWKRSVVFSGKMNISSSRLGSQMLESPNLPMQGQSFHIVSPNRIISKSEIPNCFRTVRLEWISFKHRALTLTWMKPQFYSRHHMDRARWSTPVISVLDVLDRLSSSTYLAQGW